MKKKLVVLVMLVLVVSIASGLLVLPNYTKKANKKTEPTFFENMNDESIMFMPTGIAFAHSSPELYNVCMHYAEQVYKVSSDMSFGYIARTDLFKNIKEAACGKMVRFDVDENYEFFRYLENKENTSGEFSKREFIKNNKSAWGVQYFFQSELSYEGGLVDYIVFEQRDGSVYIGVALGGRYNEQKQQWGNCLVIFNTEIVSEDDIVTGENNIYGDYYQVVDDYLFDIDCDGENECITAISNVGWGISDSDENVVFIVSEKGFGALKSGTDFKTQYLDSLENGENCFLEENGELFFCCEGHKKTKHKITLNKEQQKVIVEKLPLAKNKLQKHKMDYSNIETTAPWKD